MEKGFAQGKKEEKEKIVRNLLSMGMNVEQVARATELDIERVKELYL